MAAAVLLLLLLVLATLVVVQGRRVHNSGGDVQPVGLLQGLLGLSIRCCLASVALQAAAFQLQVLWCLGRPMGEDPISLDGSFGMPRPLHPLLFCFRPDAQPV